MVIIEVDLKRRNPSRVIAEYPDKNDLKNPIGEFAKFIAPGVLEVARQRMETTETAQVKKRNLSLRHLQHIGMSNIRLSNRFVRIKSNGKICLVNK